MELKIGDKVKVLRNDTFAMSDDTDELFECGEIATIKDIDGNSANLSEDWGGWISFDDLEKVEEMEKVEERYLGLTIGDKVRCLPSVQDRIGWARNPETNDEFKSGDVAIVTEFDKSDDTVRLGHGVGNWVAIEEVERIIPINVGDVVMITKLGSDADNPETGLPFELGDIGLVTELHGNLARINKGVANIVNVNKLKSMEEFKMAKTVEELVEVVKVATIGTELEGKLVVNPQSYSEQLQGDVVLIGNELSNNEIHALFINVDELKICGLVTRNFEREESLVEVGEKIMKLVPESDIEFQDEPDLMDFLAYALV